MSLHCRAFHQVVENRSPGAPFLARSLREKWARQPSGHLIQPGQRIRKAPHQQDQSRRQPNLFLAPCRM